MSAIINTLIFSIIVQKPKSVNTFLYKLLLWLLFLPVIRYGLFPEFAQTSVAYGCSCQKIMV